MKALLIATGNAHKTEEFTQLLKGTGFAVQSANACGGMPDVVEDGDSFAANAAIKARALRALAAAMRGCWRTIQASKSTHWAALPASIRHAMPANARQMPTISASSSERCQKWQTRPAALVFAACYA